jgi:hypothetical protein
MGERGKPWRNKTRGRFESSPCSRGEIMAKRRNEKYHARTCLWCGIAFEAPGSEIRRGKGKYCSLKCSARAGAKARGPVDQDGPKNPHWKGDRRLSKVDMKNRYRAKHPLAAKAHDTTQRAKARGKLKPTACEDCGTKKNLHGHHDDYAKPLVVRWLCGVCHRKTHGARG